ncbi:hypothetical protein Tco_1023038, partial [Tanacetum coccineum]
GLKSMSIRRIQGVGYGVLGFIRVWTTFDIFQNILFLYSLNTAYWSCVLRGIPKYYIWSIVDVDMTYTSKSGNGLLVRQVLDTANVGHDAAYGMPWKTLMKMMTEAYCPGSKIKKLEIELWNLTVKVTDVASYM